MEKKEAQTPVQNQRYRITIKGKVQGIFLRDNVKKRALELGVKGWCRRRKNILR